MTGVNKPDLAAQHNGAVAYFSGRAAEDQVAALYERRGAVILKNRWRGQGGEIDLILREADDVVFVEVKKARSLQGAAERLSTRQMQRIQMTASEYLAALPDGLLSSVRFDVAAVDATGRIEIHKNAIGHF